MTSIKQKIAIALVASAAGGAGIVLSQSRNNLPDSANRDGAPILKLALADTNGGKQNLAQWRGKVLAINFWATWCAPCREEMPEFSQISLEYAAKGVQFVGIGIDSVDNVKKFSRETPVAYPLLTGESDAMQASAAVGNKMMALPFTAILDRNGNVTYFKLGKMGGHELKDALNKALLSSG